MGNQEALTRWELEKRVMDAYNQKKLFKMDGQFLTPHEFMATVKDKWVFPHTFTVVDPRIMIDKGRLRLYELMSKQMLFEKKFHDYYDNPPDLKDVL